MYRQGASGALIDIYEQAVAELKKTIENIADDHLTLITDPLTTDENCRSVQTILSHVVHSAYGYATSIYNLKSPDHKRPGKTFHLTIKEYLLDLDSVFAFTEKVFRDISDAELEQMNDSLKIKTGWGQLYDIEQLTEHAIVHILRHKRQIERIQF
ncbi:hypothetical protein BH11BAC4_BH11BAC4_17830 [soil metagenome]